MTAADHFPESDFHRRADAVLGAIEDALLDGDLDADMAGGILTVSGESGGTIVINRNTPLREIWVAAPSGGFHFRLTDDNWRDTRSGELLADTLSRIVQAQYDRVMIFTLP